MKTKVRFALLVMVAFGLCFSMVLPAVGASDEEDVLQVPLKFAAAMNTSDSEMMSSLWLHSDKTTSFYPSGNPFLYEGWEINRSNWESLSTQAAGSRAVTMHHVQATMLGDNMAVTTAYANDVFIDPETKEETIGHVRQTLVLQKTGGKWLIVHHHASMLPVE